MQVTALFLANKAAVVNGLLNVNGGGWDEMRVGVLPTVITGTLCAVVEDDTAPVPADPSTPPIHIQGIIRGEDQAIRSQSTLLLGSARRAVFTVDFSVPVWQEETLAFELADANGPLARTLLPVVLKENYGFNT